MEMAKRAAILIPNIVDFNSKVVRRNKKGLSLFLFLFVTDSHYVALGDLELSTLLSEPQKC
jgi:hypothetical protein